MGGAVISLMDWRHERSLIPSPLIQKYRDYGVNSKPMPGTETSSTSAIYHNGKYSSDAQLQEWRDKLANGPNQAQRFVKMCEDKGGKVAVNYRTVEKVVKEDIAVAPGEETKTLDITYLSPCLSMTYAELIGHTRNFSRGLAELGIAARSNISIYEETRWEWLATIYGIWLQDMVASTVYANLGEDALFYALHETESKAIICNGRNVSNLLKGVAAGKFPPCAIIYLDELPAGCQGDAVQGCRVISWKDVAALGEKVKETRKADPPAGNDSIALIMYTSGTTGDPKGVVHTHGSLTTGILIMDHWLWSCVDTIPDETYISYLPLAHIMEFGVVNIFLARETRVCFGSPRTLTDLTTRPRGDLPEFRPTLMVGVPRVFDTLKRAVEAKLPPKGSLKRRAFDNAYAKRREALKEGLETPYLNDKVFKQARAALGGRLRFALSGGGPLAETTQEFVNIVFGPMVVGWGLTETVCIGAIQRIGDMTCGNTGQVLVAEELKLVDTEEYKHTDTPEPRGEMCLRGPFMFKGYYKNPELTKEAIDEDGWFHTGDIGSITKDGKIRLVGRVKALVKNCLGEYIALEALEAIYAQSPLVLNNSVCVVVHPERNYIAAVAITDKAKAVAFAKANNLPIPLLESDDLPSDSSVTSVGSNVKGVVDVQALVSGSVFRKRAAESMAELARQHKRKRFECVRKVLLVTDEWTPENGLCTAAMKLKRNVLNQKYETQIAEMFAEE